MNLDDAVMTRSVQPSEIKLDLPDFDYAKVFDADNALAADAAASSANGYTTTITHKAFGGCSTSDAVDVLLNGVPLASGATANIRSWDLAAPWNQYSLPDFAAFGYGGYPRYNVPSDCSDFNGDNNVDLNDFSWFGTHHGHTSPYAPANLAPLPSTPPSNARSRCNSPRSFQPRPRIGCTLMWASTIWRRNNIPI